MPNLKFRPKHRRKRRGAPILVGVLCAAVFSAAAAGIWQLNPRSGPQAAGAGSFGCRRILFESAGRCDSGDPLI